jgi:hypothetical protein
MLPVYITPQKKVFDRPCSAVPSRLTSVPKVRCRRVRASYEVYNFAQKMREGNRFKAPFSLTATHRQSPRRGTWRYAQNDLIN